MKYIFFNDPRLHLRSFFPRNPTRHKWNQPKSCSTQQRESGMLSRFNFNHNLLINWKTDLFCKILHVDPERIHDSYVQVIEI